MAKYQKCFMNMASSWEVGKRESCWSVGNLFLQQTAGLSSCERGREWHNLLLLLKLSWRLTILHHQRAQSLLLAIWFLSCSVFWGSQMGYSWLTPKCKIQMFTALLYWSTFGANKVMAMCSWIYIIRKVSLMSKPCPDHRTIRPYHAQIVLRSCSVLDQTMSCWDRIMLRPSSDQIEPRPSQGHILLGPSSDHIVRLLQDASQRLDLRVAAPAKERFWMPDLIFCNVCKGRFPEEKDAFMPKRMHSFPQETAPKAKMLKLSNGRCNYYWAQL